MKCIRAFPEINVLLGGGGGGGYRKALLFFTHHASNFQNHNPTLHKI